VFHINGTDFINVSKTLNPAVMSDIDTALFELTTEDCGTNIQ